MVIRNFYIKRISIPPHEAHAILIVNPNAVLSRPIPAKRFQMISRRHLQVIERDGRVQNRPESGSSPKPHPLFIFKQIVSGDVYLILTGIYPNFCVFLLDL